MDLLRDLHGTTTNKLKHSDLTMAYNKEMGAFKVVADLEYNGIAFDPDAVCMRDSVLAGLSEQHRYRRWGDTHAN